MNSPKQKIRYLITLSTALVVGGAFMTAPATVTAATKQAATDSKASAGDRVETRIKDLHAKLKITPAQEDLWSKVTEEMRDQAKTMDALHKTRADNANTMTAIDDLNSYAETAAAHADGIKKFTPVFKALYDTMPDDQKKNADAVFRSHTAMKQTMPKSK